jgi:hypothetical protein
MLQRIRYSVEMSGRGDLLGNIVEADETYVGGTKHDGKRGRGASGKTPVVGIAERKGERGLSAAPAQSRTPSTGGRYQHVDTRDNDLVPTLRSLIASSQGRQSAF